MRAGPFRISDSTPGAILQPQPPPCESEVRRGSAAVAVERFNGAFMTGSAVPGEAGAMPHALLRVRTGARAASIVRADAPAGARRGHSRDGPGPRDSAAAGRQAPVRPRARNSLGSPGPA